MPAATAVRGRSVPASRRQTLGVRARVMQGTGAHRAPRHPRNWFVPRVLSVPRRRRTTVSCAHPGSTVWLALQYVRRAVREGMGLWRDFLPQPAVDRAVRAMLVLRARSLPPRWCAPPGSTPWWELLRVATVPAGHMALRRRWQHLHARVLALRGTFVEVRAAWNNLKLCGACGL